MTLEQMLAALKVDLGLTVTAYDERLTQMLTSAQTSITREGITLDLDDLSHCQAVIAFTAWMWRKRDTGEGMPRMVRSMLNDILFSQKMTEEEA